MTASAPASIRFRDLVLPREHGSWSLAFEPVALGLIAVPSWPGALLAAATLAAFLTRRPVQVLARAGADDPRRPAARHALGAGAVIALTFAALATLAQGVTPLWPLIGSLLPAALYLHFDRQGENRALAAELAGVIAFAFLPATIALLGGASVGTALVLTALAAVRSLPTVLTLRTCLRRRRNAAISRAPALVAAFAALAVAAALVAQHRAPFVVLVGVALLTARTVWLLSSAAPDWRAARLGAFEACLGLGYAAVAGLAIAP